MTGCGSIVCAVHRGHLEAQPCVCHPDVLRAVIHRQRDQIAHLETLLGIRRCPERDAARLERIRLAAADEWDMG